MQNFLAAGWLISEKVDANTRNCDKIFLIVVLCNGRAFNRKFYSRPVRERERVCVHVCVAMEVLKNNIVQNKNSIDYYTSNIIRRNFFFFCYTLESRKNVHYIVTLSYLKCTLLHAHLCRLWDSHWNPCRGLLHRYTNAQQLVKHLHLKKPCLWKRVTCCLSSCRPPSCYTLPIKTQPQRFSKVYKALVGTDITAPRATR